MTITGISNKHVQISAVVVILAIITFLWNQDKGWAWATIGLQIEFVAVVFLLLRELIENYGNSAKGHAHEEALKNSGGRDYARAFHSYLYAIAIPLIIFGILLQFVGNPPKTYGPYEKVTVPGDNPEFRSVNAFKLDKALELLFTRQNNHREMIDDLRFKELLIVNCGMKKSGNASPESDCDCPQGYVRVKDTGQWDLNAGTKGDRITLCHGANSVPQSRTDTQQ